MQAKEHTKSPAGANIVASAFSGTNKGLSTAQHWLNLQCNMIQGVSCGLLFRIDGELQNTVIEASWPHVVALRDDLMENVRQVAQQTDAYIEEVPGEGDTAAAIRIYHPIKGSGAQQTRRVVVLDLNDRGGAERKVVSDLLRWNGEWLSFAVSGGDQSERANLEAVFSMALACLDQREFRSSAMALVTELAAHFACQRVSLGLYRGRHIEVDVISHSARFKQESNLVQGIAAAMEEAIDQDTSVVYPAEREASTITIAHAHLARQSQSGTSCSVPVSESGEIVGVLTLEWAAPRQLDRDTDIRLIEQLAALIAPVLALKLRDEQSLPVRAWHSLKDTIEQLFSDGNAALKLSTIVVAGLIAFFALAQADWRVTADAVVEGSVQRTIAAPIDGYIATAEARAGDIVKTRQLLGALDDRDLRLERLKWSTLRQQLVSESREAMAQHNRAEVGIVNAKVEQANAELKLLDEQLARTRLLAPFDGIVIEGDLSQLLGTPVNRGDTLFKIAPLENYRIVLKVDEQDIAPIEPGQAGALILASMPGRRLEMEVEKVTPVSTAEEGRNYFRVEASLLDADLALQPGMEGVGKIEVGEANLFWIWTRDLLNWLRLQTWTWSR